MNALFEKKNFKRVLFESETSRLQPDVTRKTLMF